MPKSIHRPEYDILRRHLRDQRTAAGWTQVALSGQLGRSQSFVSDIERGVRRLDLIELRDICVVLGVDFMAMVKDLETELVSLKQRSR